MPRQKTGLAKCWWKQKSYSTLTEAMADHLSNLFDLFFRNYAFCLLRFEDTRNIRNMDSSLGSHAGGGVCDLAQFGPPIFLKKKTAFFPGAPPQVSSSSV